MSKEFDESLLAVSDRINEMSAMNEGDEIYKQVSLAVIATDIEHMNLLRINAKIELMKLESKLRDRGEVPSAVHITAHDTGKRYRIGLTAEELITLGGE